jgi:hypothetical protein
MLHSLILSLSKDFLFFSREFKRGAAPLRKPLFPLSLQKVGSLRGAQPLLEDHYPLSLEGED